MESDTVLRAYDFTPLLHGEFDKLTPQHWGILAGSLVYGATVCTVLVLMVMGGTFRRMKEQRAAYEEERWAAREATHRAELRAAEDARRRVEGLLRGHDAQVEALSRALAEWSPESASARAGPLGLARRSDAPRMGAEAAGPSRRSA